MHCCRTLTFAVARFSCYCYCKRYYNLAAGVTGYSHASHYTADEAASQVTAHTEKQTDRWTDCLSACLSTTRWTELMAASGHAKPSHAFAAVNHSMGLLPSCSHRLSYSRHYPRDAMLARDRDRNVSVCPSVRPSVTCRYCVKTKKASGMISSPSGSPKTLVF